MRVGSGVTKGLLTSFPVSFTILSMNEIGRETFKALGEHSSSLRSLSLFSLERTAFQALNELQHCLSLESLRLEGAPSARRYLWEAECKQAFQEVVQWLQKCTALRELEFTVVPTATTILAEVLKSPVVRLTSLSLLTFDLDKEFCLSLLKQQDLRHLAVKIRDEDLLEADDERHTMLANAVACCHELRELDTNELFSLEEIEHICASLPWLEEIVLNGDLIDNEFLTPLSRLSKLKSLNIFGPSVISPDVVLEFLEKLAADPKGKHDGLQVWISNQNYDSKFTDEEEAKVTSALWDLFRGRFDINYRLDPDELHESDFSD